MKIKRIIPYFTLLCVVLISTFFVWLPFLLRFTQWFGIHINDSNFQYIYKQFDGPLYVIVAKTLYLPDQIKSLMRDSVLPQDPVYYTAHLPLYPLLIRSFSPVFGYLKSMITVTLLFSVVVSFVFYFILSSLKLTKNPLLLTAFFLLFPRFFVVRSTGSPEPLFISLILFSLYFFETKRFFLSGIFGMFSVWTKTPGILLFVGYGLALIEKYITNKKFNLQWLWILLIPVGLLFVFIGYGLQTGDELSYFRSGDNIHLVFPFSVFNFQKPWVGTAWLEDILFLVFFYGLTVVYLKDSKQRSFFYFSLVFLLAVLFVQHRDISRYSLPLLPLACIAFERFLTSKKTLYILLVILPAVLIYSWNFIVYNTMPITEWLPFL